MAKVTVLFGVLLIVLGVFYFVQTGHIHYTSLIPSGVGAILIVLGLLAETPDSRKRMLFMHIAVTLGLLGCLFTSPAIYKVVQIVQGKLLLDHPKIEEKAAMSLLLLIYVVLCVRSFIAARRSRV